MLTVRAANDLDLGLLSEIGTQTFSDSFGEENSLSNIQSYLESAFNSDQIKKELHEDGTRFFLAFDENTIAGYAKVRNNTIAGKGLSDNSIELQRIYVVKNYIGKKGRRLADAVLFGLCRTKWFREYLAWGLGTK